MRQERRFLLDEIEGIINTMPPRATIRHTDNAENAAWFGRVSAAIEKWNPTKSSLAREYNDLFFSNGSARETIHGLTKLQVLLNQAKADLEKETRASQGGTAHMNTKIFIGHGGSPVWHELKSFLNDRLQLECIEFNSEAVAGKSTTERLRTLLDNASFAFLVMSAEDLHADNTSHARENVIHEAGLFQGRLGFERAIILLEDGCAQFSNIHGLTHIGFPKGNLAPAFERIRQVLEREGIHRAVSSTKGAPQIVDAPIAGEGGNAGEPCPKCFKNGWHIESSAPDDTFGVLGVAKRLYRCHLCGFSESKLVK